MTYLSNKKSSNKKIKINKNIYIAFHKPYGVLAQFTSEEQVKNLSAFNLPAEVYAAGRLDKDSEGLLLLTNDGALINQLLSPQFAHPRTYWVQVEGRPTEEAMKKLAQGVVIQDYRTLPCEAKILHPQPTMSERNPPIRFRQHIPTTWIEITLVEGKNRQVRRMTAAVGYPTLRLIRVRMNDLFLDQLNLAEGEWKEISKKDIFS